MGVYTFPRGICPKVNVIERLEFELASSDSAVQRFNSPLHHEDASYILCLKHCSVNESLNILTVSSAEG